jgi:hypothetical protein
MVSQRPLRKPLSSSHPERRGPGVNPGYGGSFPMSMERCGAAGDLLAAVARGVRREDSVDLPSSIDAL